MKFLRSRTAFVVWLTFATTAVAAGTDQLLHEALEARANYDTNRALELLLRAESIAAPTPSLLQQISREYTDLVDELPRRADQRDAAERALDYALRAYKKEPAVPLYPVSVAIAYGKLAQISGVTERTRFARLVKEYAERALALDPNYAWAHHVLGRWNREVAELGRTTRNLANVLFGGLPPASLSDAIAHLERAATLDPAEVQHQVELASAYMSSGDHRRARVVFERALNLPSRAKIDAPAKERARAALTRMPQ